MSKLFRYEGECENYHNWISSPTESIEPPIKSCPVCGIKLTTFQRNALVGSLNFILEAAEYRDMKGHLVQEKRYHLAIQDQNNIVLARSCHSYIWQNAIKELEKLRGINGEHLFKGLKNKNWSVYI
jgi:hypothetical protein